MNLLDGNNEETLIGIPLFSGLSAAQLKEISVICSQKRISKREIIFMEGDYYRGFYILLEGVVKIFKLNAEGKESVIHLVKPLTAFADIPLFEGGNYPVSAKAIQESLTLFVPRDAFIDLLKNNSDMALKMLAGFARRLKSLVAQVEDLSTKEIKNRLAKYLIKEIHLQKSQNLIEPFIKLTIPKATLASYLGTITETLSRTFNKLQNEGIIRLSGKKVFIADIDKLLELGE